MVQGALTPLFADRFWQRLRLLIDVVVLYLAACAALFGASAMRIGSADRWLAVLFPLLTITVLRARRSPDDRLGGSLVDTVAYVTGCVSLACMVMIASDSILGGIHPVGISVRLWLFGAVYLGGARAVLLSARRRAMRNDAFATPTLVVGAGVVGEHLVRRLAGDRGYGLRPVGFLDANPLPRDERALVPFVPVLGSPEDLPRAIEQTGARHVVLAFTTAPDHELVERVRECQQLGVEVSLVPRLYESVNERATLDFVGGMPLLSLHSVNPRGWQFALKHAIDRFVAAAALIALAPLLVTIALAVRLGSPGPIFFRQRRVGRDGHEFDILKFRTMRLAAPAATGFELADGCAPGGVEGVDRRTWIGRWLRDLSLDELPQLINVLVGDMSLIGPRPERPEYVERFTAEVRKYGERHRVKSGITGWAQVNGLRGQTSIADRVEWDNYYIQNWSLGLDLRILVMTAAEVLRFRDSATSVPPESPSHPAS
jgi:exopolysaccharide biosynthesis polyprenyl glycosylphosphotransferase